MSYYDQYDPFHRNASGVTGSPFVQSQQQQAQAQAPQPQSQPQTNQPRAATGGSATFDPTTGQWRYPSGQTGQQTGYRGAGQAPAAQQTYTPQQTYYQGPPAQSYGYQQQPPAYSQQGTQTPAPSSGQTSGWYQAPTQQPYGPQTPGYTPGINPNGQQPGSYPNTGVVPPWWSQGQINYPVPQQPTYQPPAQFDTDGYARPQWMPSGPGGVMAGWDMGKWNDPGHLTPKYVLGHIASQYAPRTQNVPLVVADLQRAYGPGVRQIGDDKVYIPGVGTTDILQAAGSGGKAWQFLGGGGPSSQPSQPETGGIDPYGGVDPMTILQYLGGLQPQAPPPQADAAGPDQTALLQSILTLLQQQQSRPVGPVAPNFAFY